MPCSTRWLHHILLFCCGKEYIKQRFCGEVFPDITIEQVAQLFYEQANVEFVCDMPLIFSGRNVLCDHPIVRTVELASTHCQTWACIPSGNSLHSVMGFMHGPIISNKKVALDM